MFKDKEFQIRMLSSIFIVAILYIFIYILDYRSSYIFILILSILMSFEWNEIVSKADDKKEKNIWSTFGIFYIILTLFPMIHIKFEYSNHLLMWLFILVWSVDTFAYIVGAKLKLGNHKITTISPKKSYEGLLGGIVAASIICFIFASIFIPQYKYILLFYTPILAIVEQMSDITESFVKRHFKLKDSGNLIPGHGGILDRFDGFLWLGVSIMFIGSMHFKFWN